MEHVEHRFGPGETIQAAIRKYNKLDMPQELVEKLSKAYNELNRPPKVPHVGETVKIPVYDFDNELEKKPAPVNNKPVKLPTSKPVEFPTSKPVVFPTSKPVEFPTHQMLEPQKETTTQEEVVPIVRTDEQKAMLERDRRRKIARLEAQGLAIPEELRKEIKVVENKKETTQKKSAHTKQRPKRRRRKPVNAVVEPKKIEDTPKPKPKPSVEILPTSRAEREVALRRRRHRR